MGFNFTSRSIGSVFEDNAPFFATLFRAQFGPDVPLGSGEHDLCLDDELGWSWWSALQAFAQETLGKENAMNICAVDVFQAVYLDVPAGRYLIWPELEDDYPKMLEESTSATNGQELFEKLHKLMQETTGIEFEIDDEDCSDNEDDDVTPSVTRHMAGACAVREGEQGAFQIGSLCGLMSELGTLLEQLGVEPSVHAVDELRRKYSENEDHCDDDPHIQCLCHAWLTGHDALAHNVPLWVMK